MVQKLVILNDLQRRNGRYLGFGPIGRHNGRQKCSTKI